MSEVFEKVKEIIVDQLDVKAEDITMEKSFKADFNADSLSLFQIINEIEDAFDIKIENVEGIETVGDTIKLIEELKK